MAKIREECPYCKGPAVLDHIEEMEGFRLVTLVCGHTYSQEIVDEKTLEAEYMDLESVSGHKPFKYQAKTAAMMENAEFRCGVFHEQGLGKTICALLPVMKNPEKLLPMAILCKAGLTKQWEVQVKEWLNGLAKVQIINNGYSPAIKPGALDDDLADLMDDADTEGPISPNVYVISMDSMKGNDHIKNGIPWVKYVVIDECQAIKNSAAKRTIAVQNFLRDQTQIAALSGTPFKNNAKEYFPILNILNPTMFYSEDWFIKREVNYYWDGWRNKYGGLRRPEEFKAKTKDFIFRYTREEVMPDLPKVQRQFFFVDVADAIQEQFDKELEKYTELYDDAEDKSLGTNHELRSSLFKLWHLTGLAKVPAIADAAVDFLRDNPEKKIVIWKHHKDVGQIIKRRIDNALAKDKELAATCNSPLTLDSDSPHREKFQEISTKIHWVSYDPKDRVLIASERAAGEGFNFQSCADTIVGERQWTPMDEEQCEGRFSRPGSTAEHIFAQYFSAVGTVDDFFYELVEKKRQWFHEAMSGKKVEDPHAFQSSIMQELADALANLGRKKFVR